MTEDLTSKPTVEKLEIVGVDQIDELEMFSMRDIKASMKKWAREAAEER